MQDQIEHLEQNRIYLKRELAEVQARLTKTEALEADRRALAERRHAEEQVFLQKQQIQLQSQWDNRQQQ